MQTKLFIGTRVTPELKARLGSIDNRDIQFIPFAGKEYVGLYLASPQPTLQELRKEYDRLTQSLQMHLPDLRADTLPFVVFPQLMLG